MGWKTLPERDLERYVSSLRSSHGQHEFEFALIDYKGNHLGVTRCVDCKSVVGALPIPIFEYKIIQMSMKTIWEMTKEEAKKSKKSRK